MVHVNKHNGGFVVKTMLHLVWIMACQLELVIIFQTALLTTPQNTILPSSPAAGQHCHVIGCHFTSLGVFISVSKTFSQTTATCKLLHLA